MEYTFKNDDLKSKTFSVKQFENSVTKINFLYKKIIDGVNIEQLSPRILVSTGDVVPVGDEVSYNKDENNYMKISWLINERFTQKCGTSFIQLAFCDGENNLKLYSDKYVMTIESSVNYQKDILEYNPLFVQKFKENLIKEIELKIPVKISDLENDCGFVSKDRELSSFVKKEELEKFNNCFEPKKNRKQIIRFTTPINSNKVIENVEHYFNSGNKYPEVIFISLDSNGKSFSLNDISLYVKRSILMNNTVNMKIYANAKSIDDEGTLLIECSSFFVNNKGMFGCINSERKDGRWDSSCRVQDSDSAKCTQNYTYNTGKFTDDSITSLKIIFEPVTESVTNILSGTVIELWGTED